MMQSERPADESALVIERGRVFGGLETTGVWRCDF